MIKYSLIVAFDNKCGIGKNNQLPWDLKNEMKHFTNITKTKNTELNKKNKRSSDGKKYLGINT